MALAQAVICLEEIGTEALSRHKTELTAHALDRLRQIDALQICELTVPDQANRELAFIPFDVRGVDRNKVPARLGLERNIGVRSGCLCAHPYILHIMNVSVKEARNHQ